MANANKYENQIGYGRLPSIASNGSKTAIIYSSGEDIMVTNTTKILPEKLETVASRKLFQ